MEPDSGLNEKMDVNTSGMQQLTSELLLLFLPSLVVNSSGTDRSCWSLFSWGPTYQRALPRVMFSNCWPVAAVIPSSQTLPHHPPPVHSLRKSGVCDFLMGEVGTLIPCYFCFRLEAHHLPESLKVAARAQEYSSLHRCMAGCLVSPIPAHDMPVGAPNPCDQRKCLPPSPKPLREQNCLE